MSLSDLEEGELKVVKQCLRAAVDGPFFPDWEFQTLFGLERHDVKRILELWPEVDDSKEEVQIAINNSFNNLLGYPRGREEEWSEYISVSSNEVLRVFEKWRKNV